MRRTPTPSIASPNEQCDLLGKLNHCNVARPFTPPQLAGKERRQVGGVRDAMTQLSFRSIFTARLVGFLFALAGVRVGRIKDGEERLDAPPSNRG